MKMNMILQQKVMRTPQQKDKKKDENECDYQAKGSENYLEKDPEGK